MRLCPAARCGLALLALAALPLAASAQDAVAFGGGEHAVSHLDAPLRPEQRAAIQAALDASVAALRSSGKLGTSLQPVTLSWPLATTTGTPGAHGISNFVDHDAAAPGSIQDYTCGSRTYDLDSGYNHQGTDIFVWPFAWYRMDHDQVQAVAAAPGTIVLKQDGNPDRSCSFENNDGQWNAVYLRHADGSTTWYGHLKRGSLTRKAIGATVERGEVLGTVGSSGFSTGVHLHFEVYDAANQLTDPYAGACNLRTAASWWDVQRPYYDSAVNQLMTGEAPAVFPSCPIQETPNARDRFAPGERVFFTTFYRDQRRGQVSQYRIVRPDGTAFRSWTHSSVAAHYAASWWYWAYDLPANAPAGTWTFEVAFENQTYTHPFVVASSTAATDEAPGVFHLSAPVPNPSDGRTQVTLTAGQPQHVTVEVFDLYGRRVALLHDGVLAGAQAFFVDGTAWPSGVYVVRATGAAFRAARLLTLAR